MNGIFLRGGISIGPYHYDNDILLSPPMIRAYKLETERVSYPVIIVEQQHIAALRQLPGIKHYAVDAFETDRNPTSVHSKAPAQQKGERFFFLDYLNYLAQLGNHGFFLLERSQGICWIKKE